MINIVLAINDNFIKQAATTIMSIYKNSKKDSLIEINILHSDVSQHNQDIIKDMVKDMENISELNFIDMKQFIAKDFFDKYIVEGDYISSETYYRLFIPNLFPQYDKVLYLDSDIIACEDLTELYNIDINNLYVGAVTEYKCLFKWPMPGQYGNIKMKDYLVTKLNITNNVYFNAGVLLFNLNEMRKDNIQEKTLDFLFKNYPLAYYDEDILNSVLNSKVKLLDRKYNVYYRFYLASKRAVILHFAGSKKPWNSYKKNEGFELYWKYFKLTPFYNKTEEKLYLELKNNPLNKKKNIKMVLGRKRFRIKIFHHSFSIDICFLRKSKKKLVSLLCTKK